MTRRTLLSLPAAAIATRRPSLSQDTFPGVAYRNYSRCVPDFYRDLAKKAYELRNGEIAKLKTPEAIEQRQRWARETFWKLIGGALERTPLNARTVGSFGRNGYKVEKIVYESRPNFPISANLYIPATGKPPYPGILFQLGHSANGKAYDSYQCCCQGLAQLGYLVLTFDPMGQGERVYYPNASGTQTRLASSDAEHTVPGKQMLLAGTTSSQMQVWDAIRSLDYLAAHPLVDPKRLASTGQSGGGTLTMLLSCLDDRLAAVSVTAGNTENIACAGFIPPGSTDDAEQDFLNSGPLGFDRWDVLYPLAPKPLLIHVSDKDFFGTYSANYISSGWEEFRKLKRVYEVLGKGDRLQWSDTPLPHGLEYDSRLQIYNWFARWLKGDDRPVEKEPPTAVEPEKALWVSDTGNMVRSFKGETPFTLNRKHKMTRNSIPLDRLLGAGRPPAGLQATVLRRVPAPEVDIEVIEIQSAPQVWVPAWLYLPRSVDRSKPACLLLEPNNRNSRWSAGGMYQELAAKGHPVCVADLRCIGDLTPEVGSGEDSYARQHGSEEDYTWASLILGKPLLGQRVTDILAVAAALRAHSGLKGRRLAVAAMGKTTIPALFAAALDPAIDSLYLADGLVSYRSIVDTEDYQVAFGNFVPGILRHTDLPDVVGSLAPRKVVLAGTVNAAGRRLDVGEVRRIYAACPNAEIRPEMRWDADSIS